MFYRQKLGTPLFKMGQTSIQTLSSLNGAYGDKSERPPVQMVEEAKQELAKGGVIQSPKEKKNKFQKN